MLIEKYLHYRQREREIIDITSRYNKKTAFLQVCSFFNIPSIRGWPQIKNIEDEVQFADFCIYESKTNGKNFIEQYIDRMGVQTHLDQIVLTGLLNSYISLFEITNQHQNSFDLHDLLEKDPQLQMPVVDSSIYQNTTIGQLLFVRIVSFDDFSMTEGLWGIFRAEDKLKILRKYAKFHPSFLSPITNAPLIEKRDEFFIFGKNLI